MRNKNFRIFLLIPIASVLFSLPAFSQIEFHPGYIVKNNEDTIRGLVGYRGNTGSVTTCSFKKTKGSPAETFNPDQIKSFAQTGERLYQSINLPKDSLPHEKVFAFVLSDGPISLYRYHEYFLVKKDTIMALRKPFDKKVTVDKGVYGRERIMVMTTYPHIGILSLLVQDCRMVANNTRYSENSMMELIDAYNACKGHAPLKERQPSFRFNVQVFAGYVNSNLKITADGELNKFSSSSTVTGGLGFDVYAPRTFDKLSFSVEGWYLKCYYQGFYQGPYQGGTRYQDQSIDASLFKVNFGFRFNFLASRNTPYFKIGISQGFINSVSIRTFQEVEDSNGVVNSTQSEGGYQSAKPRSYWAGIGYQRVIDQRLTIFAELRTDRGYGFIGTPVVPQSTLGNYIAMIGFRY
jgi:hypothetical protein